MLEHDDIERLREIFVSKEECDRTINEVHRKLSESEVESAIIKTKLEQILSSQKTLVGGIITLIIGLATMLIKMFVGG